jgi:hypothetical protein
MKALEKRLRLLRIQTTSRRLAAARMHWRSASSTTTSQIPHRHLQPHSKQPSRFTGMIRDHSQMAHPLILQHLSCLSQHLTSQRVTTTTPSGHHVMNSKNFSACEVNHGIVVILYAGGVTMKRSSHISLSLLVMYSACQVSSVLHLCCYPLAMVSQRSLGSAVAVERVFSGGRDTISLRRASLKPETIRALMITKQSLRRTRRKASK